MNTTLARAAAAASGLAIAAAFAVSCSNAKEATKDAMSSASSIGSSAASAAGSAASSAASAASSAASSGASVASSVVSSVISGTPTKIDVPGLGEVSLDGPTEGAYTRYGGAAKLGEPTAQPEKVGDGTVQAFANGTIFSSPAGAHVVQGEILKVYTGAEGGPAGALGWPTSDEAETGGGPGVKGGGWISEFQNGTITWLNDGNGNFSETVTKK